MGRPRPRLRLAEVSALEHWLREHRLRPFELLSAHYLWPHGGRALRLAQLLEINSGERPKVALTLHGTDALTASRTASKRNLASRWIRRADRLQWASAGLQRLCNIPIGDPKDTPITPNYTEVSGRANPSAHTGPPTHRAIFAGHLTAIKDPLAALRAFERLSLPVPSELHVFGGGPHEGLLRARAACLPRGRRVSFRGTLSRDEFLARLPGFDLLIACSRFESFGLAALEAVAAGVPVLALRGRGYGAWLPEQLQVDVPGSEAPAALRDRALAQVWGELGSDPVRRRQLAERQRRAAQPFLGLELGRRRCRESAQWLLRARTPEGPTVSAG